MRDPGDTYEFRRVIDDLQHAPVTDSNAPLILVAFQLFAACRPRIVGQRQNLHVYTREQRIVERIQFLLRRLLNLERVFNHKGQPRGRARFTRVARYCS